MANETEAGRRRAARLFDVRLVIGGLFVVYGIIVTVIGLFDSTAEVKKAQGVHINLWMGLAMLVFGLLVLLWLRLSPPDALPEPADETDTKPSDEPD
ncbi:hypothetical protein [Actinoplanes subtropicus]|uniref:hypothetical protein n=1 Tax=Actinoplanes subtropicus TaxID=543632 RepID=UPI0004C2E757|nr:hypothetical protein [Actinoplanes subtropicus]